MFLNIIKAIYDKPTANIILNGEQLRLPLKVRSETGLSTFSTPIQYSFGIPRQSNKTSARNKMDSNREGRSQTIPICRQLKRSHIQKSVVFLYTNNTHAQKEIRETIPFIIASKTIKYIGINLTK
jgi:hypothetical protein